MKDESANDPTPDEVGLHLQRILASPLFKNSPKQSHLLRFIVESALNRIEITEKDILSVVFPPFDPESHNARQTVLVVRSKLQRYYAGEGKKDLITIDLPIGSYTADFKYHKQAEAIRTFTEATKYKEYGSSISLHVAVRLLTKVMQLEPNYLPAYIAIAEAQLGLEILHSVTIPGLKAGPLQKLLEYDRKVAIQACRRTSGIWLAHALLGCYLLIEQDREGATKQFEIALGLDAQSVKGSLWYATYLMTMGNAEEALEITENQAISERERDRLVHALFLYVSRDYDQAACTLNFDGPLPDQHIHLYFLLQSLVYLSKGRYEDSLYSLERLPEIDPIIWAQFRSVKNYKGIKPHIAAGLKVVALVGAGDMESARKEFKALCHCYPAGYLQLALGYMAMNNQAKAIAALRIAKRRGDVIANWASILPLFDPLHRHPRFQAIAMPVKRHRNSPV